jgi:hypothetical protein
MKIEYKRVKIKDPKKENSNNRIIQFWDWLWHSDSVLSWLVALLLAFITVKSIFFPLLSLITGTSLPLVVVESSSMEHPGSFLGSVFNTQKNVETWWEEKGTWYEDRGISITNAKSWPLRTGFDKGDIMVVYGRFNPEVGDVIIFNANTAHPIIHRIISIENGTIETKGDNNNAQLPIEKNISQDAVIGKAVFRIPKLGWLKLIFVEIAKLFY